MRIEAKRAEAMTVRTTVVPEPIGRDDEEDLFPPSLWGRVGWEVRR